MRSTFFSLILRTRYAAILGRIFKSEMDGPAKEVSDHSCHLMVQVMEAWLISDPEALKRFYGNGFRISAIPKNPNVEVIAKSRVYRALYAATNKTTNSPSIKARCRG